MFEPVLSAIIAAQREMKRRNAEGRVVIELPYEQWQAFMRDLPPMHFPAYQEMGRGEMTLHGGTVRCAP